MSFYSNVKEKDLINLHKLAQQQKEERALKTKNRILKQTHDIKSAESLSPITKKSDEVKETSENLGEIIEKPKPETPQLAIDNNQDDTQPQLPIENVQDDPQPGML